MNRANIHFFSPCQRLSLYGSSKLSRSARLSGLQHGKLCLGLPSRCTACRAAAVQARPKSSEELAISGDTDSSEAAEESNELPSWVPWSKEDVARLNAELMEIEVRASV